MIINKLDDAFGVVTTEDIQEGRMVLFTSHSQSYNFGGLEDLPGVKMPTSATEAAQAKYVLGFAQTNEQPPIIHPAGYNYALRYGFDKPDNTPFSATVYTTNPSVQEGLTVPANSVAVAYGGGVFTVPSGAFVYSSSLTTPGAGLTVEYTGTDKGKLKYGTSNLVAEVVHFDSSTFKLTFKLL
ncbi:MAG: hypothetical protein ACUVRK_12355 [Spirochaetota bacterium]